MNKNTLDNYLAEIDERINDVNQTPESTILSRAKRELLTFLGEVKKRNDVSEIVDTEKAILEHTMENHGNSEAMIKSHRTAIFELGIIQNHLKRVADPQDYQAINEVFQNPKNRQKGLPIDEARSALKGHITRLGNLDKSTVGDDEKSLIKARREAFKVADKLYQNKQYEALGVKTNKIGLEKHQKVYDELSQSAKKRADKAMLEKYQSLSPEQKSKLSPEVKNLGEKLNKQSQAKNRNKER